MGTYWMGCAVDRMRGSGGKKRQNKEKTGEVQRILSAGNPISIDTKLMDSHSKLMDRLQADG